MELIDDDPVGGCDAKDRFVQGFLVDYVVGASCEQLVLALAEDTRQPHWGQSVTDGTDVE